MPNKNGYDFTPDERRFVAARLGQIESLMAEMRGLFNFIAMRDDLKGQWDIAPNKSGLIKLDA